MLREKDGLVDETKLNKTESKLFIKFLEMERFRHWEDIVKINKSIQYLEDKYNLHRPIYGESPLLSFIKHYTE